MFYLQFKGQDLPCVLDYSVIKRIAAKQNLSKLSDLSKLDFDDITMLESICYLALQRGHKIEEKEFSIQESDIEEIFSESLSAFLSILNNSYPSESKKN